MFTKTEDYKDCYETKQQFGKDTYYLFGIVKDNRVWFLMSSGNKRKYIDIFEEKDYKSKAGVSGLIWARDAMLTFTNQYPKLGITKLCLGASDSRRWRIYKAKLNKYGFFQERYEGKMILVKNT